MTPNERRAAAYIYRVHRRAERRRDAWAQRVLVGAVALLAVVLAAAICL